MSYSSEDARIINIPNHVVQYKLELLNEYLVQSKELTGNAERISFNIDSTSDIRRTASLSLHVTDESWLTDNFEIGWMNKLVRFSIGLKYDKATDPPYVDIALADEATLAGKKIDWKWYVLGTMLLTSDTFQYDATTKTLQLSLVDLMAYGTAERGSQIGTGVAYEADYTKGTSIARMLSATISRWMPYKETQIAEFPDVLPYDLEFGVGTYPFDIMKEIVGLFPWYEQYYDAEGVYHADKIPMRIDEPCQLYKDDIDDLIISEQRSFDFSDIKNSTEIYGKAIKADYVATTCTLSGDTYTLGFPLTTMKVLENNQKYCFTPDVDSPAAPKIHIALSDAEAQDTADMLNSDGTALAAGALRAGYAYVARCLDVSEVQDGQTVLVKKFYLMGQKQIHVIVREMNVEPTAAEIEADKKRNDCMDIKYLVNPQNPFACDRYNTQDTPVRFSIVKGEIRQVLFDRDYASIYSTQLAYERGEYENYLKCRMNTDVQLTTILIPFIDVNQKIQYTSPITHEVHQYIVKSVNMDVSNFTMTMQLARFYPYYPYDREEEQSNDS